MWSQEIRVRSVAGGTFEWEGGVYMQIEDLDLEPVATIRPNLSEAMRFYKPAQSPKWKSAFGAITYNFWGEKMSLDVGGRYTDVHKEGSQTSRTAKWIFNIDPRINGAITSTQHRDPRVGPPVVRTLTFATSATSNTYNANGGIIDCGLPHFRPVTNVRGAIPTVNPSATASATNPVKPNDQRTASDSPCGNYGAGYYTALWLTRDIPDAWDGKAPVGMSPIMTDFSDRPGPFKDTYDSSSFDPQVVLRYRPWENLSVYAKYAEAFKSGGFDTSDRGMATGGVGTTEGQDGFSYKDEFATNYELGARGDLFDSTVRYGVTIFNQEVKDLQIEATLIDLAAIAAGQDSTGRAQINAGLQRTRGVDFDLTWMINDNFTFTFNGVVQRGRMLDFIAGCTPEEIANAATGDCWTVEESIALVGNPNVANFIDRAGSQAPRTPDWKFNVGLDHEAALPFWGGEYKYYINNKIGFSDGFSVNPVTFNRVVGFEPHKIWDMNIGIKTEDETWQLDFYGRNILSERITYNPKYDIVNTQTIAGVTATPTPQAWQGAVAGERDYFSYGAQLSYKF